VVRRLPRGKIRRFALALTVALALPLCTAPIWLPWFIAWLAYPSQQPRRAEVIAVLGGGLERTAYGAELYRQGFAPELWHTGFPEARARVERYLLEAQLPREDIAYLPSHSTWSDGEAIISAARARGVHDILLVTSWYHSRRSMCVLKQQLAGSGIAVTYVAPPGSGPEDWWRHARARGFVAAEFFKLGYYALRYRTSPWGC
jgi:uncharacterized SAM-binding protein YcdF (DUF218 family)